MDDVIVILYKREKLTEENDTINNDYSKLEKLHEGHEISNYVLSPLDIIEGSIKIVNGIDVFCSNDGKYELKMIDDISSLTDEFAYAFPIDVNDYSDKDIKETIDYMKEEELYNTYLLQSYIYDTKEISDIFGYNKYSTRVCSLINPNDYDESTATIAYDASELVKELEDNQVLLLRYEDIEKINENKEQQENIANKYQTMPHKAIKYTNNYLYSDELYDEIRKYVISQDEQIKTIATIFAKNQRIDNPYMKSNFILCGPTGCGKTEIFRQLSKIANVPMIIEDATEFTAAGYVGRTVTEILANLYNAADGNLVAAENGIILMDEIDKKAGASNDMEVNKGAVIQALLKMIEGHTYPLVIGKSQIYFDTSRVTFAFSGAFSGIEKYIDDFNDNDKSLIGFGRSRDEKIIDKNLLYNTKTLKDFGLLPEFIGRNRIIAMNELTQNDLEKILRESELSYLKLYREFLNSLNIEFKYTKNVIKAIAEKAMKEKTGARSLQSITEHALEVADYYINSSNATNYKELIITPKTIEDNKKFILR